MKKIFRKLRSRKGMTLLEMMVCVGMLAIIGAMLSSITAVGTHVYADSNFASETQTLASTIDIALSDVLNYASGIEPRAGGTVTKFNIKKESAISATLKLDNSGYLCYTCNGDDNTPYYPVQPAAYGTILMKDFSLTYSSGVFTATFSLVSKDPAAADNTAKTYTFTYRPILNQ